MNTKLFVLFCCIGFALFSSGISTEAQVPTSPKIVFESWRDGNGEIYIMNADGSRQENLTRHGARDGAPVWSPTGKHIAFHSDRDGTRDIYIMNPDGRNVRKVLRTLSYREYPTWSPDGKKLAYTRSEDWSICIADIEKRTEESVAFTNIVGGFSDWSPDGSEIIFIFMQPSDYRIRIINLRTGKEKELPLPPNLPPPWVEGRFFYFPAWSPDGDTIAFSWRLKGLHLMNRDGKDVTKIIQGTRPAWSPQGDQLLYDADKRVFRLDINSGGKTLLSRDGFDADWFDPATLPVEPNAALLTTQWGKLKEK
ncbi:MAG: hypothetical protein OXN25_10165 [Candidatus Poribacteria bacterium]|nr:hypothetical protein [Candidatus Poribacteria bacterium]